MEEKNKDIEQEEIMPSFVYRDGMLADKEYVAWLANVKARYRQSQIKASVRVNTTMLEFYWSIGRDLVRMRAEQKWGAGVVKQFALDMRQAFPNEKGFSYSNVKDMKRWYLFYYERVEKGQRLIGLLENEKGHQVGDEIRQRFVDDLTTDEKGQQVADLFQADQIRQQVADELEMPHIFGLVPWLHHVHIFTKCESVDEAMFYIEKTANEGWSRSYLEDQVAKGLYDVQGSAINNFERTLPAPQKDLAKELLKDPYNFSFLTMKEKYDEHDLEDALVNNITRFLLELGAGFAFVGRQMELRMDEETAFFPDLIFYHIPQKRYVIIELKAVKFVPEFAGKLNFYVTAADKLLRGEGDNPSVGLVICKTAKKTIVEWSLQDIQKPLGVATYQLQEVVDRTVKEIEMRNKGK
jgi:predicted nuclease of restriction endonuclease-like (RecB) superfamily